MEQKKAKLQQGGQLTSDRPQVAILDFGSQFSIRELNVFCELYSCQAPVELLRQKKIVGIILSGGPSSVYDKESPHCPAGFWEFCEENKLPVLGICYGMQETQFHFGGKVEPSMSKEFGKSTLQLNHAKTPCALFKDMPESSTVWMSHGDKVVQMAKGFEVCALSGPVTAACQDKARNYFGLQFHPEVTHTEFGLQMFSNFCLDICGCKQDWNMQNIATDFIQEVKDTVGEKSHVIGAVSGGVDSSVAAILLNRAVGKRFHAILVDNGLLRLNEGKEVVERLKEKENIDLHLVDASALFLGELAGVTDPEQKRKIIGRLFIQVFQQEAERIAKEIPAGESVDFLLQGTLYPDVIESISYKGPSATIKSHHNVGGLPASMKLKLVEPLRELFKDEVRTLGMAMGLDHSSVWRHPFPGPGLAIRIIGDVTQERCDVLRQADNIAITEIRNAGVYNEISQAFVALLPTVRSVGVMGDGRTYENACVLRCVTTTDFMTADWFQMDHKLLATISTRIINEVRGINRVCYDISSKPPATIEWE
ncbi:GMP synthase (glutamine-hydrolyzing) domain-containing protein [Batrachochytrium salamandrivorans]|nr:GMP synthase (glutamine-hydrolyzing) domain-containing protein [Batrachochytrium salamandrivorans]